MRRISDDLFEFKTLMNEKWKNVSKYLDHNSRWKFYYVCYTLYIRNEKIRYQFIEEFGMNVNYDQLFSPNEFEEDPKNRDGQLESATVFDHDCCLIQARWEEDSLIIKKISSCVENVFGYEKEEILESQLNILMPATIRSVHNEVFQNWTENKSNNPESYRVRKIYPITKKGYLIGGYLQFKQFVSTEHEL